MQTQRDTKRFKPVPVDELRLLALIKENDNPRPWSSLACQLWGTDKATMEMVRGVRDACLALEEKGLVRQLPAEIGAKPTLLFEAVSE